MAKKTLNFKNFSKYIARDKEFKKQILQIVEEKVQKQKQILLEEFNSHPVSKEIKSGPNTSNSSRTLNGYGNLFSFIGFNAGENPVEDWVNFIRKTIFLERKISTGQLGNNIVLKLNINAVSEGDMRSNAPMPWEPGRSWVMAIERGISGFSFYISELNKGRSLGGIQSDFRKKNGGSFKNTPYWSNMWKNFIQNISK